MKMEMEVHDMKTKIPCVSSSLSMGPETEKILSNVVLPPRPPPGPSSVGTNETEDEKGGFISVAPISKNGIWKRIIMDSTHRKPKVLFLLFIVLGIVNFVFPSSLLYVSPDVHVNNNVPHSTTRIRVEKKFSYFRWMVFTSTQTLIFWGFYKIMQS